MTDNLLELAKELDVPIEVAEQQIKVREFTYEILAKIVDDKNMMSSNVAEGIAIAFETSAELIYEMIGGKQYAMNSFIRTVAMLKKQLDEENKAKMN